MREAGVPRFAGKPGVLLLQGPPVPRPVHVALPDTCGTVHFRLGGPVRGGSPTRERQTAIDAILAGGEVFDGSGRRPFRADIGIRDGRIAGIGDLSELQPAERIELNGLAVCPGFVDLHTHSDFTLLVNGRAESQVHQGVTTEAVGQCGHSCAPVARAGDARHGAIGYSDDCAVDMGWQSFGDYLERLDSNGLGVNVAAFVGHGAIHRAVMGDELRAPTIDETKLMAELLAEAFDQGAYGFSTGLEYWPGNICAPEHIIPLCEVAARRDRLYATHMRNRRRALRPRLRRSAVHGAQRLGAVADLAHRARSTFRQAAGSTPGVPTRRNGAVWRFRSWWRRSPATGRRVISTRRTGPVEAAGNDKTHGGRLARRRPT